MSTASSAPPVSPLSVTAAQPAGNLRRTVPVSLGERSYDIVIGCGLLDDPTSWAGLPRSATALIVSNVTVAPLYADRLAAALAPLHRRVLRLELPDGEAHKNAAVLERIYDRLLGDASAIAAGTVTDEAHTAHKGALLRLAHLAPTAVIVTNGTGATTYIAGTDYVVSGGGIVVPETSGIADASDIKVSYAYGAQNVIQAITAVGAEYTLAFDGMNEVDSGKPCVVDLWRVRFTPAKSLDLIDDDFGKLELEGKLLKDESRPAGESQYFRYAFA